MKKADSVQLSRPCFVIDSGDYLLSHAVARAVPSAPEGLTAVFGMGTGGTPPTLSPENSLSCTAQQSLTIE
jgi:hypothetical protein